MLEIGCNSTDVSGGPSGAQNLDFEDKTFIAIDDMAVYVEKTTNTFNTGNNTNTITIVKNAVVTKTDTCIFKKDTTFSCTTEYKTTAEFNNPHKNSSTGENPKIEYSDNSSDYNVSISYSGYPEGVVLRRDVMKGNWRQFMVDSDGFDDVTNKLAVTITGKEKIKLTTGSYDQVYNPAQFITEISNESENETIIDYVYIGENDDDKPLYQFNNSPEIYVLQNFE